MLTVKASVAAVALVGTALISASGGYVFSRVTMTAQMSVKCHDALPIQIPEIPSQENGVHSLPDGGAPLPLNGKKW